MAVENRLQVPSALIIGNIIDFIASVSKELFNSVDNQQVQSLLKRIESSLRQLQLSSSERFNESYNDVCEALFDGDFYQLIWDEPVLLQIVQLFNENPPAPRFLQKVESIKERAIKVRLVNDLFSSVLDFGAPEKEVINKLQKLFAIDSSILPRLQAENKLNTIRSNDAAPSEKVKAFLGHFSEDMSVDFGEWKECIQNCLNALESRQEVGKADALLVNSRENKASVIPIKIIVQSGNGQLTHLVSGKDDFESAVERARQCLLGDGFIRPTDNVLYTLDVTEAEYRGDSIGLPAAIAMFSAAKGIEIDPYTRLQVILISRVGNGLSKELVVFHTSYEQPETLAVVESSFPEKMNTMLLLKTLRA